MNLVSNEYLNNYREQCTLNDATLLNELKEKENFTLEDFEYYVIASSLFSSKIEGNTLDFNSFVRNRGKKNHPKTKEVEEVENLLDAYTFASTHDLTLENLLHIHSLLSKTLVTKKERGKYRTDRVAVLDSNTGRPTYIAVEPELVAEEMQKLFSNIDELLKLETDLKNILYYSSMLHLWLAMIHPFADGNGRTARLLEKWFLASKIGRSAWSIQSEKYYWDNRPDYYKNIALGFNYYALKWERCLPFLLMLPKAFQ